MDLWGDMDPTKGSGPKVDGSGWYWIVWATLVVALVMWLVVR